MKHDKNAPLRSMLLWSKKQCTTDACCPACATEGLESTGSMGAGGIDMSLWTKNEGLVTCTDLWSHLAVCTREGSLVIEW